MMFLWPSLILLDGICQGSCFVFLFHRQHNANDFPEKLACGRHKYIFLMINGRWRNEPMLSMDWDRQSFLMAQYVSLNLRWQWVSLFLWTSYMPLWRTSAAMWKDLPINGNIIVSTESGQCWMEQMLGPVTRSCRQKQLWQLPHNGGGCAGRKWPWTRIIGVPLLMRHCKSLGSIFQVSSSFSQSESAIGLSTGEWIYRMSFQDSNVIRWQLAVQSTRMESESHRYTLLFWQVINLKNPTGTWKFIGKWKEELIWPEKASRLEKTNCRKWGHRRYLHLNPYNDEAWNSGCHQVRRTALIRSSALADLQP